MEVPSEVLQKLVCERCSGYLSRGPVHLVENTKYRCGRCPRTEDEEEGIRMEAYEELAKLMSFPCRYEENGCASKVPFTDNERHEDACPYREYLCPIAQSGQCKDTTFTVTSSSNTLDHVTPPMKPCEMKVKCCDCVTEPEPVYRGDRMCIEHVPEQRTCTNSTQGCTYSDSDEKCEKHEQYFCQYITRCFICSQNFTDPTLDSHYTQAHAGITHRAGTVITVRPGTGIFNEELIIQCDFGRAICVYELLECYFVLSVHTSLPTSQLHKYRCTVDISHPDTPGHTLTSTATVHCSSYDDWDVRIPLADYEAHIRVDDDDENEKVNIKINITKMDNPSQCIV